MADILFKKLLAAAEQQQIKTIALAGGVSANSLLRQRLLELKESKNYTVFIPPFEYCTDNAAMIAVTGYFKYLKQEFCHLTVTPSAGYAL